MAEFGVPHLDGKVTAELPAAEELVHGALLFAGGQQIALVFLCLVLAGAHADIASRRRRLRMRRERHAGTQHESQTCQCFAVSHWASPVVVMHTKKKRPWPPPYTTCWQH